MNRFAALVAITGLPLCLTAGAVSAQSQIKQTPKPPQTYSGQWFTTADGCSYSRAQAPGYAPTWHLILNPHHIGKPSATRKCKPML